MPTGGREEDPDTCAVCLGSFRDPKFLPCYHTFCASCIQDVADRHSGGKLPCPVCRRVTSLPSGGVASLQTNFYITMQSTQHKSVTKDMCKVHSDEKLRFYCVNCKETICRDCKLTKHEQHETEDLTSAVSRRKKELQRDQQRIQNAVSSLVDRVTSLKAERESLQIKKEALEKNIHNRHAMIVAAADTQRDELLLSLQSLQADLDKDLANAIGQEEEPLQELLNLQEQLNDSLSSGTASDIITVDKEMIIGRGSEEAVIKLMSREEGTLYRPVLHVNVSTDVMIQKTGDYLGSVKKMAMKETEREVRVTECFQCAEDPNVEVFSLCHVDTYPPGVIVSYEQCGMKKDAPVKSFLETGECVGTGPDNQVGKVTYRRYAKGEITYTTPVSGHFKTYCKSPITAHFQLSSMPSGQAVIGRVIVTSTDTPKTETKTEFTIQVGAHRAFDVDDTEQYFAVVEEANQSTHWRNVRLYQRSVETAVCTYSPPTAEYQPSDVCFDTLGGRKVLLITDELNDAIHVVSIQGGTMQFERYLCAGCPSLIQPTAITVDVSGRLWVACRGGVVLMLEKIT